VQIVLPPGPGPTDTGAPVSGFDACTAPSLVTMSAWHSAYSAVGVYIGGVNTSCAYGNLSAGWLRSVTGAGWGVLPTYVGPQAPCWPGSGTFINPASAAAEGTQAGQDAVSDAETFGLAAGSPIYYDMEGYRGARSCTTAVLTFLSAWDRQVKADGYLSGVYSSQDSGINDLQAATAARQPGFTAPDAIWFARWDGTASLDDGALAWPVTDRAKQYLGNVRQTIGGVTLDVDKDVVGGPLAR
jgi:hypothetical protein